MTQKITINTLIEAGCHFGHQTMRWNPKMEPYIFGKRGDIHIIDLKQTLIYLDKAYSFVSELSSLGKTILFVGTKKQAQEPIADAANKCGMPYVNARWLGGFLTNFATIRERVKHMEKLEAEESDGTYDLFTKKEQILLKKELTKLQTNLNGVRNMNKIPDAVFIIDAAREDIAVREALRLDVPIVATIDTNCDPDNITLGIPANDDSIGSIKLLCDFISDAVIAGTEAVVTAQEMMESQQVASKEDSKPKQPQKKQAAKAKTADKKPAQTKKTDTSKKEVAENKEKKESKQNEIATKESAEVKEDVKGKKDKDDKPSTQTDVEK